MKLIVQKTDSLSGTITIPGSKSHSVRALIFATLAEMQTGEKSTFMNLLKCDDTTAAQDACSALLSGAEKINTGNSGITTRFILPMLGLRKDPNNTVILDAGAQMKARPMDPLVAALERLGMDIEPANQDGRMPYRITGELLGGEVEVSGVSSQYLSALLISLPAAKNDSMILVDNLKERPYVEMTLSWLDFYGIKYEHFRDGNSDVFKIPGRQIYTAKDKNIPADFSSASYPLAAATFLPSEVTLRGLDMNDTQGDKDLINILQEMGTDLSVNEKEITIKGAQDLHGIKINCNAIPDLLPTLAALAAQIEGETELTNAAHARIKETDRIVSMTQGLRAMGADIEDKEDGLIIRKSKLHGANVHGFNDHRTIMALAIAGLIADGETIIDTAEGINKTFPTFVELMQSIGAKMRLVQDHIVLVGFKHVGKTKLGQALARDMARPFIDIDDKIVELNATNESTREIMQNHGEDYFRELETEALKQTLKSKPSIIATGGGVVLNEENRKLLSSEICIHITDDPQRVFDRIMEHGTPAFFDQKNPKSSFQKLWQERKPLYEELAKITINRTGDLNQTLTELKESLAKIATLNLIIGHPLQHTRTPEFHNAKYQELGLNAFMLAYESEDTYEIAKKIRILPVKLTVVTMPHKQSIMQYLDEIDPEATAIGAVNTIINRGNRLHGYNTDLAGITHALRNTEIAGKTTLLIGAGGAARTVAYFINKHGGKLLCMNRDEEKAAALTREFGGTIIARKDLNPDEIDLIINATPIGMHDTEGKSPLDENELRPHHTVFDLIYNPLETKLLSLTKATHGTAISGIDMFRAQAEEQIRLFLNS